MSFLRQKHEDSEICCWSLGIVRKMNADFIFVEADRTLIGIYAPTYFIGILWDFQTDIQAGPGRAEYANPLAGVGLWHPVLVAMNASTTEAFDTWNMRNMTDSIMTVAQHHGIEDLRGLYFSLQWLICHRPQRPTVPCSFWLYALHQSIQLKMKIKT